MPFNGWDILCFFAHLTKNKDQIDDVFELRGEMTLIALIDLRLK